ncbi:MATE family efflux transporter [uncultured Corynebacterium sp.]|uniref:MATE family efflux transporter n=1 Tax=uncultured Corynebacterium sp. TaxID=159447 RepID=UPI0025F45CD6|nr:MATE family efflux transporter [uncultured Corynebacterium sp.]
MTDEFDRPVTAGRILGLALPALGVLAAPPLYLLLDTAVVGRLGTVELAALAAGATVFSMLTAQLTFLAYGTTARASRAFGRGDVRGAVTEGVQATWVAVFVGALLFVLVQVFAGGITRLLAPDPAVTDAAAGWLRIAAFGIPLTLVAQAGNGWMRGIQDTRRPFLYVVGGLGPAAVAIVPLVAWLGLDGSAWAMIGGETLTAAFFLRTLLASAADHEVDPRPHWSLIKRQLVLGRDLILRSLAFQVAFLSAAGVAGRLGAESLGAHQIMLQLWNLLSLVLDSLAIAAQTLVGAALGIGSVATARFTARRVIAWSTVFAGVLALGFALGNSLVPSLFTTSDGVLGAIADGPWWILVAMIPVGGVVFAIDGVLLGAGDAAFLRNATITAVVLGFLPPVWLTLSMGWELTGVWWGLLTFMTLRLIFVAVRYRGPKWAVTAGESDRR